MKEGYVEALVDLVFQGVKSGMDEEAVRRHAIASIQAVVESASATARADSVAELKGLARSVADIARQYADLMSECKRLRHRLDELGPYMGRIDEMRATEMGQRLDAVFSAQRERAHDELAAKTEEEE